MNKVISLFKEQGCAKSKAASFFKLVALSVLISLTGPLTIKLPFTPVPVSLQVQVCLFLALCLGAKRGSLVVLGYILQGIMGLPVFSQGGSGIHHLMGPTGGYLLGFVAGAWITGWIAEKIPSSYMSRVLAMVSGNLVVYVLGALWLSFYTGFSSAVTLGVIPFIAADILKILAFARLKKN